MSYNPKFKTSSIPLDPAGAIVDSSIGHKVQVDSYTMAIASNQIKTISSPLSKIQLIAGQSFSANTGYLVRWGINSLAESTDEVYAADQDATVNAAYWAIGIASSDTAVTAGNPINVIVLGTYILDSSDVNFSVSDIGKPVYLGLAGAWTLTPPVTVGFAVHKIGIVQDVNKIWVDKNFVTIN